ncbi:MAG: (d)CMP kinase [Eubacteriales bacterium]|nr:(d)CMP kinase [Eubacteriales bacterium]
MNKPISIAIDGPSGAGKSTIAKTLAKKLGFIYIDTGAMYRAVGLYVLRRGVEPTDLAGVEPLLADIDISIAYEDGTQKVFLNNEDVSDKIRTPQISKYASDVSAHVPVRLKLVELQRGLANSKSVIMDGRDIGTYVLPDAQLKIFLTASGEERAKRRYLELTQKGAVCSLEEIARDMAQRDENDSKRAFAPLKAADDSIVLDSTTLTQDEVVEKILELYNFKCED